MHTEKEEERRERVSHGPYGGGVRGVPARIGTSSGLGPRRRPPRRWRGCRGGGLQLLPPLRGLHCTGALL